ncbi:hypothetical protein B0J14DRAFT_641899 [Halenospora varia]|nr:hypothetical protein B0J14DRAFT_641899 [Halenospora varia]
MLTAASLLDRRAAYVRSLYSEPFEINIKMEPGLRQRRGQVENAGDKIDSNSTDSNTSLTPTASVEQELTEAREEETSDRAKVRDFLAKILPLNGGKNNATCLPDKQEDDCIKYQHRDFLLKYVYIKALAPVSSRDHRSVQNWFLTQDEYPLAQGQDDYLLVLEDLVAAKWRGNSAKPLTGFREQITDLIANNPTNWFAKLFREDGTEKKTSNKMIHYFSSDQILSTAEITFSSGGVVVILLPVFLMILETFRRGVLVVIIAIFVPLFTAYIAVAGGLRGHDLVICTAAYAMILVTALGNTSGPSVVACSCGHSS